VIVSIILYGILLFYAISRFKVLIYRENPTITVADLLNVYDARREINLDEIGFKIAFGVEDYYSGYALNDSEFV